jgi:ligand-binding sensor domain-containing protein
VFSIFQASDGFIWIGTENGVSRFDGSTFENFTVSGGIPGGEVLSIGELADSSITMAIQRKPLTILKQDKLSYRTIPQEVNGMFTGIIYSVCTGKKIYGYSRHANVITIVDIEKNLISAIPVKPYNIIKTRAGVLYAGTESGIFRIENDTPVNTGIINKPVHKLFEDEHKNLWAVSFNKAYKIANSSIAGSFKIHEDDSIVVKDLAVDYRGRFYFNLEGGIGGAYLYDNERLKNLDSLIDIGKAHITSLLYDNEGNLWIGTIGRGVFCLYNHYLKNYTGFTGLKNNYVRSLAIDEERKLYIGTYNGINILENDSLETFSFSPGTRSALTRHLYVYDIISRNSKELIVLTNHAAEEYYKGLRVLFFPYASLLALPGDNFMGGYWSQQFSRFIFKDKKKSNERFSRLPNSNISEKINKIYMSSDSTIYFGAISGLYILKDTSAVKLENNNIITETVYDIKEDRKGRVWVATDRGIAMLNGSEWTGMEILGSYNLSVSRAIAFDADNRAWIGCLSGLYVYNEDSKEVLHFNQNSGLTSSNISCLCYDPAGNQMVIGTNAGVTKFSIEDYNSYTAPGIKPYIKKFTSGDSAFTGSRFELPHYMNNIKIAFSAVQFREKELVYRYRLGEENNWIETRSAAVELLSLNPGSYRFELGVKTLNSAWSEPLYVDFIIKTPFYRSGYFYLLIGLTFLAGITAFSRYKINKVKKAERKKRMLSARINELKQYALTTGMMNPHFIFNSLNSIQHFINSNNAGEASNYLAKFSRLIRMNIDSAFTSFTPLNTELERLEMYLALESLRFGKRLSYSITVGEKVNKDLLHIPNMIVQPFVENSIWHGILPRESGGHISISVFFENGLLKIIIKDNGVGLEHKKTGRSHISKGMKIVKERLRLLRVNKNPDDILKIYSNSIAVPGEPGATVEITLDSSLYTVK